MKRESKLLSKHGCSYSVTAFPQELLACPGRTLQKRNYSRSVECSTPTNSHSFKIICGCKNVFNSSLFFFFLLVFRCSHWTTKPRRRTPLRSMPPMLTWIHDFRTLGPLKTQQQWRLTFWMWMSPQCSISPRMWWMCTRTHLRAPSLGRWQHRT